MALCHGDLVRCCVELLNGFDSELYATENRISDFFQQNQGLDSCEQAFITEVFSGCVLYGPVLNVVLRAFYNSDGKYALISDQDTYKVLAYLILFRLDELGMTHIKKFVNSQDTRKAHAFLSFFLNEKHLHTWMKDEWSKIYDSEFVQSNLLQPLLRSLTELQVMLEEMKKRIDSSRIPKKCMIPMTDPEPFKLTPIKPKKIPMPEQIPTLVKHKPVPKSTYQYPTDQERLNKIKAENKKKSEDRYDWIQKNSLACTATGKSAKAVRRMEEIVETENNKLCFDGVKAKLVPISVLRAEVPIKLNAAAILREEKLYKQREEAELKKLERLEAGEGHDAVFLEWQARMRKLDVKKQLEEVEQRRLAGLLSQEEAIIAKQKLVLQNKDRVTDMKAEAQRLMNEYMEQRLLEEEKMRRLMEKVTDSRENAKEAKLQLQAYKAKIVQEMNEEAREMMQQALEEAAIEMQQKMDLIHEIRAMQATSAARQPRIIDFTETGGYGLLCEMSVAELRERLRLLQISEQEEEMAKRKQIINDKQAKTQMLVDKLDTISKHRTELSRVAAIRFEERKKAQQLKVKPVPPRTEALTEMEKRLEAKKAERRKLEEDMRLGQDAGLSQQRLRELNATKKLSEEGRWSQLEHNRSMSKMSDVTSLSSTVCQSASANSSARSRTALLAL